MSREAFKEWVKEAFYRAPVDSETLWEAFGSGWQAAKAQAGDGEAVGYVYHTAGGAREVSWFDSQEIEDDALLYTKPQSPRTWNHFSLDTMPPPNVPLLVKFKDVIGVYAAMFHVTELNEDFDFWFSTVSHANANLESPDVYDSTNHTCEEWSLLYTAPPAAVNQQAPEGYVLVPVEPTIEMIAALGFGGDVDMCIGHAAISESVIKVYKAALAAAQEQSK